MWRYKAKHRDPSLAQKESSLLMQLYRTCLGVEKGGVDKRGRVCWTACAVNIPTKLGSALSTAKLTIATKFPQAMLQARWRIALVSLSK
jgi:hypothetical protein